MWNCSRVNAILMVTLGESTLFQVMAWWLQATCHYLSQCWSLSPYGVTKLQWVIVLQIFFWRNIKIYLRFLISRHSDDTCSWNPYPWKPNTCLFYIDNILTPDDLMHISKDQFHNYQINSSPPWTKWLPFWQTTFSNAFSWMKMIEFKFNFHWNLFRGAQLTIIQHWFR